ncbi:ABC transporter ATP-binding protein [Alloalcanivorax mobilis]|uniref:ABC transporter ATP-binding protein n=1 Tax=Alloalcanivorax mobilis TaxID=2019569 RepID=UPI000B5B2B7F|nr:ABC transporter ATP-binding protein [Alloalcanivorax mobilis]ASK34390.1 ABC transporter [Alcanivorax sp. N3-2A]|tara:strand:+ start:37887 stop:38696 length:810 start_codon:yes stop_codon:yes gene_type:complete
MGASISLDGISHRYKPGASTVLEGIENQIGSGECAVLIGRSGCGKSTLLHMMAGLLLPSEGCVRINGRQVVRPSAKWNMMFQKPSLYPWMNVRQNVGLGLEFAGTGKAEVRDKVDQLLDLVGLADSSTVNVQSLSGGQQQRVALARSLATHPDVLLLDEPFSALDAFTRASLQQEVTAICRARGITLVTVTHDIDEAILMADRVLIMTRNPGRIENEMAVPLPWPRDTASSSFQGHRRALMDQFEQSDGVTPLPEPESDRVRFRRVSNG